MIIIIICLYIVVGFEVFLSNTNNLHTVIWFQVFLFNYNHFQTSFLPIDMTLTNPTTLGPSGPGSNDNEVVTPHSLDH